MAGVAATLELEAQEALRSVSEVETGLVGAAQAFAVALADAVSSVGAQQVEFQADAAALTQSIDDAVGDATTETNITGDAEQLTLAIDDAVASADPTVEVDGDAAALTGAIDEAIAAADPTVTIEADTAPVEDAIGSIPDPDPIEVPVSAPGLDETNAGLSDLASAADEFRGAALGGAIGAGALGAAVGGAFGEFSDAAGVVATLDAVLANLGDDAGITSSGVQQLAGDIQRYSGFSDEAVTSAAALVAQLGSVKNQAGEGNDAFDRTIKLSADMARLFGTDITSAARSLGRALADPERGISRLERSIGPLDAAVKENIITLAQQGDTLGAQTALLDALEGRIGGVAAAYGGSLPGAVERAGEQFGEFTEDIGQAAATLVGPLAAGLAAALEGFQSLPEPIQRGAAAFLAIALAGGSVIFAINAIRTALPTLVAAFTAGGGALASAAPILLGIAAAAGIAAGLMSLFGGDADDAATNTQELVRAGRDFAAVYSGTRSVVEAATGAVERHAQANDRFEETLTAAGLTYREFAALVSSGDLGVGAIEDLAFSTEGLDGSVQDTIDTLTDGRDALNDNAEAAIEAAVAAGSLTQAQVDAAQAAQGQAEGLTSSADASSSWLQIIQRLPPAAFLTAEAITAMSDAARENLPTLGDALSNVDRALQAFGGQLDANTDPQLVIDNLFQMVQAFSNFTDNLATLGTTAGPLTVEALSGLGPEVAGAFTQALVDAPQSVRDQLELVLAVAQEEGVNLTDVLTDTFGTAADAGADAIADKGGRYRQSGKHVGDQLTAGAADGASTMPDRVGGFADETIAGVRGRGRGAAGAGQSFGKGFGDGTGIGAKGMTPAATSAASAAVAAVRAIPGAFLGGQVVGHALTAGMASGIAVGSFSVVQAARGVIDSAIQAARAEAGIASPSKVFAQIGRDSMAGLTQGFTEEGRAAVAEAERIVRDAATAAAIPAAFGGAGTTRAGRVVVMQVAFGRESIVVHADGQDPAGVRGAVSDGVSDGLAEGHERVDVAFALRR